ncbi:acetolactate decarboxylase [Aquabacter spiritensis]|uniref:Alpha-acetolactate decarboxylase n=1 Tax=Aquabacter spiritensis TaxID=933073 RepID=A0A4R3LVS8_9HYPH|nr:acetolactate decarboxylase [Aquabacter spiritensis]TCT04663.1 acetolactate decarboxylase [Aquabacter spiritensis]
MPTLTCEISQSLLDALNRASTDSGEGIDHIVSRALADTLQLDHGTLFQVSTAGALVEGLFSGVVSVETLKEHGDFGLGTFAGLDGEMIALDGTFYQIRSDGSVREARDDQQVPFAEVTHFAAGARAVLPPFASMADLLAELDQRRGTDNLFFAVRLDGCFVRLHHRVASRAAERETLVEATAHQAEFHAAEESGTMVGFWTPAYVRGIGIPGWHLHFISADRARGGHVLDCAGAEIALALEAIDDFRLAMPETAAFLAADLSRDTTAALDTAERGHGH